MTENINKITWIYEKVKNKKNKYTLIKKKLISKARPKNILLSSLENSNERDRRTKEGKRQAADISPSYQTRKSYLKGNTIETYISPANSWIVYKS